MRSEFWDKILESTGKENGKKLPFFSLAPMEAVTDVVFRHVVVKAATRYLLYRIHKFFKLRKSKRHSQHTRTINFHTR